MNEFIPKIEKKQRTPKIRYNKPESVRQLEQECFAAKQKKHPTVPYLVRPTHRDDTANGLTKCITAWLELHGHFAGRVNTTGTYSAKLGKYIHSGSRRGMADITAIINGQHVSIEVKIGRDTMRPEQLRVKEQVEQAGGVYVIARSFDSFLEQINHITK